MVVQDPHEPGRDRSFSPDVRESLERALRDYDPQSARGDDALRTALAAAAEEARTLGFGPADVVLALKLVESSANDKAGVHGIEADQLHRVVLQRMLKAYFGQPEENS